MTSQPSGAKYWKLTTGDFRPSANQPVSFKASVTKGDKFLQVDASVITAINGLTSSNVAIDGHGVSAVLVIDSMGSGKINLKYPSDLGGEDYYATETLTDATFKYYLRGKPAYGIDAPIQAVLSRNTSHGSFVFLDRNGAEITVDDGSIIKGTLFYTEITGIKTCTSDKLYGVSYA
jgi:hypothetical protein